MNLRRLSAVLVALACVCLPQQTPQRAHSFVEFVSASNVSVTPGHSNPVEFTFHVEDPYHINSNQPLTEELIPTQLHFSLPAEVGIGRIQYPAGKLVSFPFDPSTKLSVYSGDVVIRALAMAPKSAASGTYTINGEMKYQACDNNACYPPKKLPFSFNVKIATQVRVKTRR